MNVKDIQKENGKAKIAVVIDAEAMDKAANKAYLKARKNIALPGFRKGKAPRKLIENIYGAHVFYEDGIEEIFPELYAEVVESNSLRVVGRPSVSSMNVNDDGSVELTIETELYPEVTLGQYKGLEMEKGEPTVSEEEIAAELDRMAQKVASVETVERAAEMGDTAVIDFEGFDQGVAFEGGKGENYELKLGSGSFVPGFEEQVVGMSAGEEKDIDITFPENYHENLAGKPVVFHVKLHKVTTTILPEMDDEFAKDVSDFETLDALKEDIRKNMLANRAETIDNNFRNAVIDKALENVTVEVPESMVEMELDRQMENFAYQLQMSGMTMENYAKMMGGDLSGLRTAVRPGAVKQAKLDVMLDKIAEVEGIEVSDEEVEAEFQKMADSYQMEVAKVKKVVSAGDLRLDIRSRKASEIITDTAVAVAPKASEE